MTEAGPQKYKFQDLEVYQLALRYLDSIYELSQALPEGEKYNLRSQMERASISVVLNIAEGSTGQTDPEQGRFVTMAVRSYLETVACLDIAQRRNYLTARDLRPILEFGRELFAKLQALRRSLCRPRSEDR
jgi:four helix bundle protein